MLSRAAIAAWRACSAALRARRIPMIVIANPTTLTANPATLAMSPHCAAQSRNSVMRSLQGDARLADDQIVTQEVASKSQSARRNDTIPARHDSHILDWSAAERCAMFQDVRA